MGVALTDETERLRKENARLRGELERQLGSSELHERVLKAARDVARESGFAAELTEIARRAGMSASSIYRHFANREAVLQRLVERCAEEVREEAIRISGIEAPEDALREWMLFGFSMVDRWGMLATQISADLTPAWALGTARPEDVYRSTGELLKRWRDAGLGRPDMDVRSAVRVWFALVTPFRVRGCLADGMTPGQIADETLAIFRAYYAASEA